MPNHHYHQILILMVFMDIVMKIQALRVQKNNTDTLIHHGFHGINMEHQELHAQILEHCMNISMMSTPRRHFMLIN